MVLSPGSRGEDGVESAGQRPWERQGHGNLWGGKEAAKELPPFPCCIGVLLLLPR